MRSSSIQKKSEILNVFEELTLELIKKHKSNIWLSKQGKLDFGYHYFKLTSIDQKVLQKSKLLKEKVLELNLSNNKLTNIDVFSGMKQLKILDASDNLIENIKLNYPALEELILEKNRFLAVIKKTDFYK